MPFHPVPHHKAVKPPAEVRLLARQQMRMLGGTARLLSLLLRSSLWTELRPSERRRVLGLLARVENDMELAHVVAHASVEFGGRRSSGTRRLPYRNAEGSPRPDSREEQEALPSGTPRAASPGRGASLPYERRTAGARGVAPAQSPSHTSRA